MNKLIAVKFKINLCLDCNSGIPVVEQSSLWDWYEQKNSGNLSPLHYITPHYHLSIKYHKKQSLKRPKKAYFKPYIFDF
ncbi:MAG: hypothetical protein A3C63_02660 [Candidatus Zambryskibacteria bacterium RIFCSPHIGHO2_02_FULL_39_82]|nr:MAG: hypothetical protein A3C63_02660 [Candidatus Zambryskibacteria bacterium RIFCSPHIGHO2_02_FULL_39_82]